MVNAGNAVLAVDLRSNGQTQTTTPHMFGPEYQDGQIAYELGRSIVGMQAEDALVCGRYAAERVAGGQPDAVELVAIGNIGIPALHAAALEPAMFRGVRIRGMIPSWASIVHKQKCSPALMASIIHGALRHFDLPNLETVLGKKLTIEQPQADAGSAPREPSQPNH
jgi:hypothetical protein